MKATNGHLRGNLSRRTHLVGLSVAVLALIAVVAVGCETTGVTGDAGTVATAESPTTAAPAGMTTSTGGEPASTTTAATVETMTVRVYFSMGQDGMGEPEKIYATTRVVPKTEQVGAAAMQALLEGPTEAEEDAGMITCIPEGTTFLDLEMEDGVAYVDMSAWFESGGGSDSELMRWAQVVFTLTQFPTVDGVRLKLDGELREYFSGEGIIVDHPCTRKEYEDMSPAILVESPTAGQTVSSPMRITGSANVFEAQFMVNIVNWDGLIIAEKPVMATSGTGTRGTFDVTVPFDVDRAGLGALIVFDESAEDGSPIYVVEIPLQLED